MSITRRIAFGAAASWFSRGVTILLGLVLMPVLFRHLPKEELGIWLLLGQSWATMGILDLGVGVTLTRRIALAKGKSGGDPDAPLTQESLNEIADLVASGRRIYRFMALGVFAISWVSGFYYLRHLELHGLTHGVVWTAWTVLCACQALNVWATVWTCLLQGVGYVGWDAIIASFVQAGMLIGQIAAVLCGGGLVWLAVIAAASAILQRVLVRWLARRRKPELFSLAGRWNPGVLHGMMGLAFRAWLTAVGTVLVQNTDGFFIASAQGAENIPAFRAAFLVVLNLHMLASVFASSSSVFISHLWQAGDVRETQRVVRRNLRLGLSIMLCGSAAILAAGPALFNVWLGPERYVGWIVVALFVASFVLEQQSFVLSTGCRATNDEAFGGWMIAGGLLKIALAFLLMKPLGLAGLAVGTLLAQVFTAHWFVLYRSLQRLKITFASYLTGVAGPCCLVFGVAAGLSFLSVHFASQSADWLKLAAASTASGLVLLLSLWWLVLDANQRQRLAARMGWNPPLVKPAAK